MFWFLFILFLLFVCRATLLDILVDIGGTFSWKFYPLLRVVAKMFTFSES